MAQRTMPTLALIGATLAAACGAIGQEDEIDGAALFGRYCASCHGPRGEGDGPVAGAMLVTVPNLRTLEARSNGAFPRDAVVRYIDGRDLPPAHGERLMPVWGATFAEPAGDTVSADDIARRRITAIAEFIESLQN